MITARGMLAPILALALATVWSCGDEDALGTWKDPQTGLTWMDRPSPKGAIPWLDAVEYCDDLELGSNDDWRLPMIGELRTLIRGCPDTVAGGTCLVDDDCFDLACAGDAGTCDGCGSAAGTCATCFMLDELDGECSTYWSFSGVDQSSALSDEVWVVDYCAGSLAAEPKDDESIHLFRCVR